LADIPEPWPHAQNDALGYFLWILFTLVNTGHYELDEVDRRVCSLFPAYFAAIEYWRDPDSGHWEETPKINSSSIGVVVGGLREMRAWIQSAGVESLSFRGDQITSSHLHTLENRGVVALQEQLPHESANRRADAALLFLIYPIQVVSAELSDVIITQTEACLVGLHGIRRYEGDSYWCPDYDSWSRIYDRPSEFASLLQERDSLLQQGCEAQWCIFDPVLSVCYGRKFLKHRNKLDFGQQLHYLNRALGQVTRSGQCPELYYLSKGAYVPNHHVPLAWTQANLAVALEYAKRSFACM